MPLLLSIKITRVFLLGTRVFILNSNKLYGIDIEKNGCPLVCCPISLTSINATSSLSDIQDFTVQELFLTSFYNTNYFKHFT